MRYWRYGEFRFWDYKSTCGIILFYILFGTIVLIEKEAVFSGLVFVLIGIGITVEHGIPLGENFEIKENEIISYRGKKLKK